jgi:acetyltransferase-like isoleucine patch superfamily enzyme
VDDIRAILSEILGQNIDPSTTVLAPFSTNFGKHTKIGKNVFINHGCSFLDLGGITIEDDVLIGPQVKLVTENHPVDPSNRKNLDLKSIHIGNYKTIEEASEAYKTKARELHGEFFKE